MKSVLNLYLNSKILPNKLFKVDNIERYLATLSNTITKTDFQYIKHSLFLVIKVDFSQSYLEYIDTRDYNYCSIKNDNGEVVYYFILDKRWKGQSTLELTLSLDTINTFFDKLQISEKTKVLREHKDRFKRETTTRTKSLTAEFIAESSSVILGQIYTIFRCSYTFYELIGSSVETGTIAQGISIESFDSTTGQITFFASIGGEYPVGYIMGIEVSFDYTKTEIIPIIDFPSEGLTPVLFGEHNEEIKDPAGDLDWYLIYANQNAPDETLTNPVDCFVCASSPISLKTGRTNYLTADMLEEGKFYYIMSDEWTGTINNSEVYDYNGDVYYIILLYRVGNQVAFAPYRVEKYDPIDTPTPEVYLLENGIELLNSLEISGTSPLVAKTSPLIFTSSSDYFSGDDYSIESIVFTDELVSLSSINDIDRTDSKLIKIFKIPYAPFTLRKVSDNAFEYDPDVYTYDNTRNMLKLTDLNLKFKNEFEIASEIFSPLKKQPVIDFTADRNIENEMKLYHSDFYSPKLVYDTFSLAVALERTAPYIDRDTLGKLIVSFMPTSTINSKFIFKFNQLDYGSRKLEDFDKFIAVSRNNEITIFNQQYINYIRNGYNYDLKAKDRNVAGNWIGVGLSSVGAIASFVGGAISGQPLLAIAGISLATTTISQVVSAVNSQASQESQIEQKIAQLKAQSTSVSGSDDVDLMSVYCNNRLQHLTYKVSEKLRQSLFDLFHYCGYISEVLKVPTHNSRYWFDFVSAEIQVNDVPNIPQDFIGDISEKFKVGITFLHEHNNIWNFAQDKENIEVALL